MVDLPDHVHGHDEGGDSGKDGACDEVGAEDGAVPHGLNRHGEDEGNDRMDGDRNGDDKDGHEGDPLFEETMLSLRPCPAEGKDPVKPLPFSAVIPQEGDIRNQGQEKIDRAGGEINGDARNVPEQRGSKLRVEG